MKIIYDLFPAQALVTAPNLVSRDIYAELQVTDIKRFEHSRRVEPVRIVLTEDMIMVAADGSNGPMLIFREKYLPDTLLLDKKGTTRLITVNGKALAFRKDSGCGCGSMLRAWNPYKTLHSMKDPTQ
jgi:hypothetical protein